MLPVNFYINIEPYNLHQFVIFWKKKFEYIWVPFSFQISKRERESNTNGWEWEHTLVLTSNQWGGPYGRTTFIPRHSLSVVLPSPSRALCACRRQLGRRRRPTRRRPGSISAAAAGDEHPPGTAGPPLSLPLLPCETDPSCLSSDLKSDPITSAVYMYYACRLRISWLEILGLGPPLLLLSSIECTIYIGRSWLGYP